MIIRKNLAPAAAVVLALTGVRIALALPAADDSTASTDMEEIVVSAKFVNNSAYSAMKQNVDVRDTPYSVSDYSSAFMNAIETAKLTDLYSYMTGVSRGGVTGYDISIRGFKTTQSDQNAILIDGLPGLAGRVCSPPTLLARYIRVLESPVVVP